MSSGVPPAWSGPLADWIAARRAEFDRIDDARRAQLVELAGLLATELDEHGRVELLFVCTHNSRRSQLGQVWAHVAAERTGVEGVRSWSGGTEVTAFDRRAIAALERVGLLVERAGDGPNPTWLVRTHVGGEPIRCSSKHFADPRNPTDRIVAVMTCGSADAGCPAVPGAVRRVALLYEDPKSADGTPGESEAYDARCRQIARELLYVFDRLAAAQRRVTP